MLASYNKSNKCYANMEALEGVLFTDCCEFLSRMSNIEEEYEALD
jgi:hypothetical protein